MQLPLLQRFIYMDLISGYKKLCLLTLLTIPTFLSGQFLMDMVDTTTEVGKGLFYIYKKFDRIQIGGYIQPQYQLAEEKGIKTYNAGDFPRYVNNRFMLRRGRIRFDYAHFNEKDEVAVQFVFQFDGTERGVFIRDFWGRIFENRWKVLSFTSGMFARPFGYEVNLSSSDRESPERGMRRRLRLRLHLP